MIATLLAEFWGYLVGAGVLVAALLGLGRSKKVEGKREERAEAKERDHEKAAEIRNRVERDLDQRLRDHNDSGWRD